MWHDKEVRGDRSGESVSGTKNDGSGVAWRYY